jgi:hypothetical protein
MRESRHAFDHPAAQTRLRLRLGLWLLGGILAIQGVASLAHPRTAPPTSAMSGIDPGFRHVSAGMVR